MISIGTLWYTFIPNPTFFAVIALVTAIRFKAIYIYSIFTVLFQILYEYDFNRSYILFEVAQAVQCLIMDRTAGDRSPTEAEDFCSNLCIQTGSGAHPASCTVGTGGSFPGGKAWPGRDADHSPPSSAEVKKE
jgi:hypothetical protein